jgi:tetratricopeptide (TPR) repeat protein
MNSQPPIVRKTAWLYTIPQLLILFALMIVGAIFSANNFGYGGAYGAAAFLIYSFGSKSVLLRNHRKGIYFAKLNSYQNALREFQLSYQFLDKHQWVDKYRFLVMLDSSAISYREMALCNIAYSHVQLRQPVEALQYYRRALEQFPKSHLAKDGIAHVETEGN